MKSYIMIVFEVCIWECGNGDDRWAFPRSSGNWAV